MLGQIWSALTRKPQSTQGVVSSQLDPIVKYRLALYVTTTSADGAAQVPVLIRSRGPGATAN